VLGVVVVLVVGGAGFGLFFLLRSGRSDPKVTAVQDAVRLAPVSASVGGVTVGDFASGSPLGGLRVVADGLVGAHGVSACKSGAVVLGRLGSPSYLRAVAAGLPDPVAGDLASGVVSATVAVLSECSSAGGPSRGVVEQLRVVTAGLTARLGQDRR
jgi:hypothetical protein